MHTVVWYTLDTSGIFQIHWAHIRYSLRLAHLRYMHNKCKLQVQRRHCMYLLGTQVYSRHIEYILGTWVCLGTCIGNMSKHKIGTFSIIV